MATPAKRLRASVPALPAPMPLSLGAPEAELPAQPEPFDVTEGPFNTVETFPLDESEYDDAPNNGAFGVAEFLNEFSAAMAPLTNAADAPIIDAINNLSHLVDQLVTAVNTIGQQQQWMVEQVVQMKGPFDQMMAGGGSPLKMMMGMISGKGVKNG